MSRQVTHTANDTTGHTPSDRQLMAELEGGSPRAFAELYDRHSDQVYRLARSICADADRAEEVVEAAFISFWRNRASLTEQAGTVAAWLLTAVLEIARVAGDDAAPAQPGSGQTDTGNDGRRMWALLDRLPDTQRQVIALAFSGLTHAEIAARLELPAGTVDGRMRLGMEKLSADIEREVA